MQDRVRNKTAGNFVITNKPGSNYLFGEFVELKLAGPTFTGVVVEIIDENGNQLGSFDFNNQSQVHVCEGRMMLLIHTKTHGDLTANTFLWIPPGKGYATVCASICTSK